MKKQSGLIALTIIVFAINLPPNVTAQKSGRVSAANRETRTKVLGTVDQFKAAFQNDTGKVRLVALISPT